MTTTTRRSFLREVAIAGTAATLSAQRLARAEVPSKNIHFALIGAGGQGCFDAANLLKVPGLKLTAICDINPHSVAMAQQLSPDARVYEDWQELLAKEDDLQAAIVALPEDTHAPATIAALEAEVDVYCEKPMAYSLEQSRAMIAARDRTKRVLQIGQQRRSNPLYYLAERMVLKEGVLGEVLRIDTFWDRWEDWKRPLPSLQKDLSKWDYPTLDHLINWRLYRKYGHGLITENGTHQLDVATWMLGGKKAKRVCGMGAIRYRDNRETHDICSAEFMFEGDTIVRFNQDFHQGLNYGWSYGELLLGSEAAMRITAEQQLVIYDRNRKATNVSIERLGDIELAGVPATREELVAAESNRDRGGLKYYSYDHAMRIFVNCINTRNQPTCTGEMGHDAITFTVTGADAQYDEEMKTFRQDMFA